MKYALYLLAFVLVVGIGKAVIGFFKTPTQWEETITIKPSYPSTYHTLESTGRCSSNWFFRKFRARTPREDMNCLTWDVLKESESIWRNAELMARPKGPDPEVSKRKGELLGDAFMREGVGTPAVLDLRTTNNTVIHIRVRYTCDCRRR